MMKIMLPNYLYLIKTILNYTILAISWTLSIILLILAIYLKDPYLFIFRAYETLFIAIACCLLLVIYYKKTSGKIRIASIGLVIVTLLITFFNESYSYYYKHNVLNNKLITNRHLGQHFIVGYGSVEQLKPLVSKGLIGGIFITKHNVAGKSIRTIQRELAELQQIRIENDLPPLIIATDQEGGAVSRMSPPLNKTPPLSSLITTYDTPATLITKAKLYGQQQGQALAKLGINLNFSPVVDLKFNKQKNKLDLNSLIEQRAISADPILTTQIAIAYSEGLQSAGITPTFKHFPGLGRVYEDTHYFSAILTTPIEQLETVDWLPYKAITQRTDIVIMLSHVILSDIDNEIPVSFSKKVIQHILRDKWQYDGILITDDLTMRAAYNKGLCKVGVQALNAGIDLLLISYDYEKFYEVMYCVNQAYENNLLNKTLLKQSQQRLTKVF